MRKREYKPFCIANNRKQDFNNLKGEAIPMLSNFRNLFNLGGKALGEYVEARSIDHVYKFPRRVNLDFDVDVDSEKAFDPSKYRGSSKPDSFDLFGFVESDGEGNDDDSDEESFK